MTICLGRRLRGVSSDRYPRTGRAAVKASSYLVLLRAGFTWPAGHPVAGGLLPHLFTLTWRRVSGDSRCRAVIFCGTFLRVAPTGCYPAPCSLEPGLSSNAIYFAGGHPSASARRKSTHDGRGSRQGRRTVDCASSRPFRWVEGRL